MLHEEKSLPADLPAQASKESESDSSDEVTSIAPPGYARFKRPVSEPTSDPHEAPTRVGVMPISSWPPPPADAAEAEPGAPARTPSDHPAFAAPTSVSLAPVLAGSYPGLESLAPDEQTDIARAPLPLDWKTGACPEPDYVDETRLELPPVVLPADVATKESDISELVAAIDEHPITSQEHSPYVDSLEVEDVLDVDDAEVEDVECDEGIQTSWDVSTCSPEQHHCASADQVVVQNALRPPEAAHRGGDVQAADLSKGAESEGQGLTFVSGLVRGDCGRLFDLDIDDGIEAFVGSLELPVATRRLVQHVIEAAEPGRPRVLAAHRAQRFVGERVPEA